MAAIIFGRNLWFRSLTIWQHFADYFPVDLVKTAELRPDRNYVVASFPHGIMWYIAVQIKIWVFNTNSTNCSASLSV